jgi:hypothetical protein
MDVSINSNTFHAKNKPENKKIFGPGLADLDASKSIKIF